MVEKGQNVEARGDCSACIDETADARAVRGDLAKVGDAPLGFSSLQVEFPSRRWFRQAAEGDQ